MSRFVIPETHTLTLANGDRLVVWVRLNAGQARARNARMYTTASDGTRLLNLLEIGRATVLAFLVDWTLADEDIPIRGLPTDDVATILDRLAPEDFYEIRDAIDEHEAEQQARRAAEKKTTLIGASTS